MNSNTRLPYIEKTRLLVVKVGTSVLSDEGGRISSRAVGALCRQLAKVREDGRKAVLVTSGAIAAGVEKLGLKKRPSRLPELQAAAAAGQGHLMGLYSHHLADHGLNSAQLLLTREDFSERHRYLNARNTILSLLRMGAVPIINENDTVSTEEITFGENDTLSALVGGLVEAQLLILLTDVEGLVRKDAGQAQEVVKTISKITPETYKCVWEKKKSSLTVGGMESKLKAAEIATEAGQSVIIANGNEPDIVPRLLKGEELGTFFPAKEEPIRGWKRWLGRAAILRGKVTVDDGATDALVERGKSLLPAGVVGVTGDFEAGELVSICTASGREFARGLSNYSSADLLRIKGLQCSEIRRVLGYCPYDEAVHRDNLLVLKG